MGMGFYQLQVSSLDDRGCKQFCNQIFLMCVIFFVYYEVRRNQV